MAGPSEEWMKLKDASKHFEISESSLNRWIREFPDNFVVKKEGVTRYVNVTASKIPENARRKEIELPDGCISLKQAKDLYELSHSALYMWIHKGYLTVEKHGNIPYVNTHKSNPPNTRMEPEQDWKQIPGFPDYDACCDGRIRNNITKTVLTPNLSHGYYLYHLYVTGKPKVIMGHRLIALTYIPNPENKPTVDHINRVKTDNRVENLRWATQSEQNIGKNRGVSYNREIHPNQTSMPNEQWRDCSILGYQVSSEGRVKNREGVILSYDGNTALKYITYGVYTNPNMKERGKLYVHREVARAFLPNFEPHLVVNHKNGNTHDNRVSNLEAVTQGENVQHGYTSGLNPGVVRVRMFHPDGNIEEFATITEAARRTGLKAESIGYASRMRTKLGGYAWERF